MSCFPPFLDPRTRPQWVERVESRPLRAEELGFYRLPQHSLLQMWTDRQYTREHVLAQ